MSIWIPCFGLASKSLFPMNFGMIWEFLLSASTFKQSLHFGITYYSFNFFDLSNLILTSLLLVFLYVKNHLELYIRSMSLSNVTDRIKLLISLGLKFKTLRFPVCIA